MDDLLSLLIFGAIILFSLLGGGKKKRPAQQQRPPVRPPPQRPRPPQARARPQATEAAAGGAREPSLQDLLAVLQGRVPEPEPVRVQRFPPPEPELPEAHSLEEFEREDRSLETLEPAGGTSHVAFHEQYLSGVPEATKRRPSRFRRISPDTAREAVIWKTIFETPKGLQ